MSAIALSLVRALGFVLLLSSGCSSAEEGTGPGTAGGRVSSGGAAHGGQFGGAFGQGGTRSIGTGGSDVSGGTENRSAECIICDHAQDCCLALAKVQFADIDPCFTFTTNCDTFSGTAQEKILEACQAYLVQQKSNGLSACQ